MVTMHQVVIPKEIVLVAMTGSKMSLLNYVKISVQHKLFSQGVDTLNFQKNITNSQPLPSDLAIESIYSGD